MLLSSRSRLKIKAACAGEEGVVAELNDLSLKDFIFKDPLVQRKPFVILSENGDIKALVKYLNWNNLFLI